MTNFKEISQKWQKRWENARIFEVRESSKSRKYYVLEMFPYPSGSGLHMGHVRNYAIGDALARYKRMQGFNLIYPMGYDAFGLPAENAAIEKGTDPRKWTENNMKIMEKQQRNLGLSYDWSRKIATCNEDYYKWNQWIFLKFLEKGLAYKKKSMVNWCPGCNTVLANEQVEQGKCWRCKSEVEQKELEQWFFKITEYAEELLNDIDTLENWPEKVKVMQENWIGKSEGTDIFFKVENSDTILSTFTTRCDTIYSVTFVVLAPEHPLAKELVKGTKYEKEFNKISKEIQKQSIIERTTPEGKDKIGCFLGKYAINPVNNEKIPIYIANFALMEYGTGVVMADAHDQRDFEFAKKYNIPLKFVISEDGAAIDPNKASRAFLNDGILFDSGKFSGTHNREALPLMADWLEENKWGKKTVNFKLRDWLISRQRYWGTPIPVVYCDKCGTVPVPYDDLPVKLPENVKFTGKGNPLETSDSFVNCKCPKCNGKARRETDTMDTFVDSSWYFMRYCSPKYNEHPFDRNAIKYWMPVDQYIGGIEHAVMHLLYARFFTKALRDLGLHNIDEPFSRLLCQGMVIKDGAKMSKSLGNVVDPAEIIDKYGPDTARLFILFAALPEKELDWSDQGVNGSFRFLNKVYNLINDNKKEISFGKISSAKLNDKDKFVLSRVHATIRDVTAHIEKFEYSLAIGKVMELVNDLSKYKEKNKAVFGEAVKNLILLIAPFTPHIAEELWEIIGCKGEKFVSLEKWPEFDKKLIDEEAIASIGFSEDVRADIISVLELIKLDNPKKIRLFVSEKWKYNFFDKLKKALEKSKDFKKVLGEVMDKQHGKDISKMLPRFIKEPSRIPQFILSQKKEYDILKDYVSNLKDEFKCNVEIIKAEDSKEPKAKTAMPGKVAIIVE
tara:strand:- start:2994 stop:5687 length:2694 start_codon:yes stop_codon:yes gene_type:complete